MEFKARKFLVIGLNGSGKTEWVKDKLRKNFKCPLIWSNLEHKSEWIKEKGFLHCPEGDTEAEIRENLEEFCKGIKRVQNSNRYKHFDAIVFDDFDAVVNNATLPFTLKDLNANNRVWDNLSLFFIIRRPEQLNANIVETCHAIISFAIEGENTLSKLKNISKEFEIKVRQLKYKDYRCVVKESGQEPYFENPVKVK